MDNKLDLVVSFDTTGSMYPVLAQVRQEVESFVKDMFTEFTDLRIGVIAHGDYCDEGNPYTIRVMDLTRDEEKLCRFVRETDKTYGGDADECYELVLNTARKVVNWREDAQHLLIMIGDASPHGINYPQNKEHLDWEEEAKQLGKEDVKIFSVHALSYYRSSSKGFYKAIAELSGGVYLTLDQFNEIIELIKATCYQQGGEEKLNEYISIIRDNGKMTHSMENNIKRLRGEEVEDTYDYYRARTSSGMSYRTKKRVASEDVTIKEMDKLVPVIPGRFQIMTVDENCDIKGFVTKNGIEFKKGRGFYELTKAETVQQYKEIIMQDKETGEMFVGSQVREKLGLQPQTESGGVNEKLYAKDAKEFRIFVQSTSVNRKLIKGTTFLYEVSDILDEGTEIKVESKPTEPKAVDKEVKTTDKEIKSTDSVVEPVEVETEVPKKKKEKIKKTAKKVEKAEKKVEEAVETTEKKVEEAEPTWMEAISDDIVTSEERKVTSRKEKEPSKTAKKTKVQDRTVDKLAKAKKKKEEKYEKAKSKVNAQSDKLAEALDRYSRNQNKKTVTFVKNNVTKMIKLLNDVLEAIDEE